MTLTASETSRWRLVVPTFLSSDEIKPERKKDSEGVREREDKDKYIIEGEENKR